MEIVVGLREDVTMADFSCDHTVADPDCPAATSGYAPIQGAGHASLE
jgi:hypothetical protein